MASTSLLLLSAALIHAGQFVPAGGRGLDLSVGGVRRQRRDVRDLMMSYNIAPGGGRASDLYYQGDDWRGRGIDQALKQMVERDQRKKEWEEQRAAYVAALLRLLNEAETAGLVGPGDVEVVEEEEDEEDSEDNGGAPGDFQNPVPADYDETGQGMRMGRPLGAWWGLVTPQLAQALLDRMEPHMAQTLLERANQERLQQERANQERLLQTERVPSGLRRAVAKLLSSIGADDAMEMPSSFSPPRARRDLSIKAVHAVGPSPHKRSRRSLDDTSSPSPSSDPPLLRVKRLEDEEEEEVYPSVLGLQRMKRTDGSAELNHGSGRRRRRRAIMTYNPQILMDQILEYMKE